MQYRSGAISPKLHVFLRLVHHADRIHARLRSIATRSGEGFCLLLPGATTYDVSAC